ncbi:MAG: exodeoxyribonuclease VII small subunit [Ilumatobacteraceae bacterium]
MTTKRREIGYAEAVAELEEILEGLEAEDADVDALAERVRRAAELIEACRARIAAAKLQIDEVLAARES